ncbi:hypothetical protein [Salisediminibacterium selenitireducens]|uniref:Uncharacterized protein n=1 Tax=Bacillus selenitireducens (strain ATCC 700615 / DSM 15326 / MLS10) TaxID=439292 RepID=D6XYT8_BACIE|nr:hypothetical protein [Salisediminibacterium selenitireducens]ADH98246.1 hypothetical protein Bsel_0713 [[Bacillus] selenitireducens MLS10]
MTAWIQQIFNATKRYTVWDFALLKLCLIAMGILIGMYFSSQLASVTALIWGAFLVSYAVIVYKTLVTYSRD